VAGNPDPAVALAILVPIAAEPEGGGIGLPRGDFGDGWRGCLVVSDDIALNHVALLVADFVERLGSGLRRWGGGMVAAEECGEAQDDD